MYVEHNPSSFLQLQLSYLNVQSELPPSNEINRLFLQSSDVPPAELDFPLIVYSVPIILERK